MTAATTPARTTGPANTTGPAYTTGPAAPRRSPGTGLACLMAAGLLWGTGGLTGSLLGRDSGLPALSVAAYRLACGGVLIIVFLAATRRRWPAGRAAWMRIAAIAGLAAVFQSCYFTAVSLTSVSLATLVTIGSAPVLVLAAEIGRASCRERVSECV